MSKASYQKNTLFRHFMTNNRDCTYRANNNRVDY